MERRKHKYYSSQLFTFVCLGSVIFFLSCSDSKNVVEDTFYIYAFDAIHEAEISFQKNEVLISNITFLKNIDTNAKEQFVFSTENSIDDNYLDINNSKFNLVDSSSCCIFLSSKNKVKCDDFNLVILKNGYLKEINNYKNLSKLTRNEFNIFVSKLSLRMKGCNQEDAIFTSRIIFHSLLIELGYRPDIMYDRFMEYGRQLK